MKTKKNFKKIYDNGLLFDLTHKFESLNSEEKTKFLDSPGNIMICGPTNFDPVWDDMDHFDWACHNCLEYAHILRIYRNDAYANVPTLFFELICPKCGCRGVRKIYINNNGLKRGMKTFTNEGKRVLSLMDTAHEVRLPIKIWDGELYHRGELL